MILDPCTSLPAPLDAKPTSTPPGYLDEAATAALLGVKVQSLRKQAVLRKGPPRTKAGRRVLYREEALKAWLLRHERDPGAVR